MMRLCSSVVLMSLSLLAMMAAFPVAGADTPFPFVSFTMSSTIVFHSPQEGQRPIHLGLASPQEVQTYTVLNFSFGIIRFLPVYP